MTHDERDFYRWQGAMINACNNIGFIMMRQPWALDSALAACADERAARALAGLAPMPRAVKPYCTCDSPFGCGIHDRNEAADELERMAKRLRRMACAWDRAMHLKTESRAGGYVALNEAARSCERRARRLRKGGR